MSRKNALSSFNCKNGAFRQPKAVWDIFSFLSFNSSFTTDWDNASSPGDGTGKISCQAQVQTWIIYNREDFFFCFSAALVAFQLILIFFLFLAVLGEPRFTNCDQQATYQVPLPKDKAFVAVTPTLLKLQAVDGDENPINVTVVDNYEKTIPFLPVRAGWEVVHFRAFDRNGHQASCAISLNVTGS